MAADRKRVHDAGAIPSNVAIGSGAVVSGPGTFASMQSRAETAVGIGAHSTVQDVRFQLREEAVVRIGDFCHLNGVLFLCDERIDIGDHVAIGWGTTIADTDFHPLAPTKRARDAEAISP